MSKKKKKKNKPYRSVLDESPIKDRPGPEEDAGSPGDGISSPESASDADIIMSEISESGISDEAEKAEAAAEEMSDGGAFLPEDDSISDLPGYVDDGKPEITPATASKFSQRKGRKSEKSFDRSDEEDLAGEPDEDIFEDDFPEDGEEYGSGYPYGEEEYVPTRIDRGIQFASMLLSVMLLGGSIVFWFTIMRHLINTPFALADSVEMRTLIICCACFPVIVTAVQIYLKRPVSAERWLICLCTSGALATLFTVISQALIRRVGFAVSDLPLILCCAFSGCTLPSVLCIGIRALAEKFLRRLDEENSRDWETVRRDVLSLTDFRL